jgi:superfamily II DNA or RNA helicase
MDFRNFDDEAIKEVFSYHAPTPEQAAVYEKINQAFQQCAKDVLALLPNGAGKTIAVRKLSDARMAANASVALNGQF